MSSQKEEQWSGFCGDNRRQQFNRKGRAKARPSSQALALALKGADDMRSVAIALLLLLTTACSSQTQLPMASFLVAVGNTDDANVVWNKVRVALLSNDFAFLNDKDKNTKNYVLKSDQDAKVILTKNPSKGFVEVVFFHYKKSTFGEQEEKTFENLKKSVQQSVTNHKVSDGVPFRRG
jgi:hypothetical protein